MAKGLVLIFAGPFLSGSVLIISPCVVLCLCFVKVKYSSCFEIFSCVKCSRSSSCVVFCSEAPFKEAFRSALTNLDLSIVLAFPGKNLDDT